MGTFGSILLLLTIFTCFTHLAASPVENSGIPKLNLNAERDSGVWTASGNNGGIDIRVSAGVPGGIYSDLEANSIFTSKIYHGFNDMETRWVGRTNWTFSRQFTPSNDLLGKDKIVLVCEGLDTIADVYINDVMVGSSRNMFVRHIFNAKFAIRAGVNVIRVEFQSPVEYSLNEYIRFNDTYGYPVLPAGLAPQYQGEDKAQMIRKMQSSFAWDWGPAYASSGIWKNIWVEGLDGAVIRDVLIFTNANQIPDETDATVWNLTARVYFDVAPASESGILTLKRSGSAEVVSVPVTLSAGASDDPQDIIASVPGSTAKLWWPNGHGDPNLYTYEVSYTSNTANETSTKTLRVGFRTLELVQTHVNPEIEEWGRNFYFLINGIPIYNKGSNFVPAHVLSERVTEEATRWLLESAKDVHSNIIRVWGGGLYESDMFYDLTDELGIMVWQDFMFACAMYPATDEFLLNVVDEVKTNVKRLQHHASLAIWTANNENESALRDNWYGTSPLFETYKADYIKLYVHTILANVTALDPSREILSSSPGNGMETEMEDWVSLNPGDSRYGDTHHFNYNGDGWDHNMFQRRTRYASEYGYQSFPHIETLAQITDNLEEWTWDSRFVDHRQRHPEGQNEMRRFILTHLPYPVDYNSTEAFPYMVYMSQITQSMAQKTQTEFFRRWMNNLNTTDGTGNNMGAIYWNLNDIWEGCSWSSIEINGRWKMLHSYIQRSFSSILPSAIKVENGDVAITLISEVDNSDIGPMRVRVFNLSSLTPVIDEDVPIEASYLTSVEVHRVLANELEEHGCGEGAVASPCIVYLTIPGLPDNFLWLHYPTDKMYLKDPNIRVTEYTSSPDMKSFTVTLTTDEVAPFVFLNLKQNTHGKFSDNGFIMVESSLILTYTSRDPITLPSFIDQLEIISLYNVTMVA